MTTTCTRRISALAATTAILLFAQAAGAADLTPAVEPTPAAEEIGAVSPWQIRVRGLGVITNDEGSVDGVAGSDLSYSDSVIPELDITYYFTDNLAAELILGTTWAGIYGEGSLAGLDRIGSTWVLPPTLTLQYHFTDFGAFKPYVGAGVNYTIFYNQDADSATDLHVKDSFGFALQAGFDYMINEHWGVNFDVKKIFLRPDFDVTVGGADLTGNAKLDPWLIGGGVTYRF
ncbi:MAG TPA: OmpW family protein [Rhizobium sp.]|nr:OmpW family protein [Rhizobium sp.]